MASPAFSDGARRRVCPSPSQRNATSESDFDLIAPLILAAGTLEYTACQERLTQSERERERERKGARERGERGSERREEGWERGREEGERGGGGEDRRDGVRMGWEEERQI